MRRTIASALLAALVSAGCAGVPIPQVSPATVAPARTPEPSAPAAASPSDGASEAPVAVLDVACGPAAPVLGSGTVPTSPDGIHLRVAGQPGWALGIEYELGRESVVLESATQEVVLRIAPGDVTVDCGDPALPDLTPASKLTIEDPEGWYRSTNLGAGAGTCVSGSIDYADGAKGKAGDPVLQARTALRGLRAGDVVERAGYPVDSGSVRVVRAGEVIGVLTFDVDGHGGWLFVGSTLCGGLGTG